MRKLKLIMLFVMAGSLLTITSCSSDDGGGNDGVAGSGTITAKIEGVAFTSLEITSFAQLTSGGGQTTLVIQGNTTSQGINIIVNGYDGVGTYKFTDSNVFVSATYIEPNISNPTESKIWSAPFQDSGNVGEIKISEETDTDIKGTFNFTAKNSKDDTTKSITEGSFNLKKKTS